MLARFVKAGLLSFCVFMFATHFATEYLGAPTWPWLHLA
jgi:hypothetical protein